MDDFMLLVNNAPLNQLLALTVAFSVWVFGVNFLKKKHRQRLESQNIEFRENIRFENVNWREWVIFAVIISISFGLLIFAVNLSPVL